jgi:putative SOS response-associated peptidase YedK
VGVAFLTTEPNAVVAPIHPKAMPVVLNGEAEVEVWLSAPWAIAKVLQRPLPAREMVLLPKVPPEPNNASAVQSSLL